MLRTTPLGAKAGEFTTHYGFAQTTGTVFAQQTAGSNGDDFFTFMGYDARTALGAPVPSLSPAAFGAAGALVLLGAGYALKRRRFDRAEP